MRSFLRAHKSKVVNVYIALNYFLFVVAAIYLAYRQNTFDYNLLAYALQSVLLVFYILHRKPHEKFDQDWLHQCIALAGFYSGAVFIWQQPTGGATEKIISDAIIFIANVLAIVTIFNLGRSFGIMIACREVKTGGLYALVRHPMYATDILLRIGFFINHFSLLTCTLIIFSILLNYYRAVLEERLLSEREEYRAYMQKVRYRFIPYLV